MAADPETALYLAARGFYIAPLVSNSKKPSGHWREQSTLDTQTIKDWFVDPYMEWPQKLNILVDASKSGLCIVDIDDKDGKDGSSAWVKLVGSNPMPKTFTVRTPTGGRHLYFRASGYTNSAGKLAPGLDIRGEGGYVVAPSSTLKGFYQPKTQEYTEEDACGLEIWVDGKYTIEEGCDAIEMPEWLHEALALRRITVKAGDKGRVIIEDDPADIEAAVEWLQECEIAVEGAGGDNHTYVTFCKLKERGLSQQTALEIAWDHWNMRCSPPWDYDDLEKKCENAYKSAQNATGVKSPLAEFMPPDLALLLNRPPEEVAEFIPNLQPYETSSIPLRPWVFGKLALRKKVTVLVAPGGAGKSTLTITMALSKASARNIMGIDPLGLGRVAMYNNEDDMDELKRRTAAIMQRHGISFEDITDPIYEDRTNIFMQSGENNLFNIAKRSKDGKGIISDHADKLIAFLVQYKIDLVIIDPFAETHQAKENDNDEILRVAQMYRGVAQKANCAVLIVHHTRKPSNGSSSGHSGNLDSMRGASSLGGAVRIALTFDSMSKEEAKTYGIPPEQCHRYAKLVFAKANMSKMDEIFWFQWESETINATIDNFDGEQVGVLIPAPLVIVHQEKSQSTKQIDIQATSAMKLLTHPMPQREWYNLVRHAVLTDVPRSQQSTYLTRIRRQLEEGGLIETISGKIQRTEEQT